MRARTAKLCLTIAWTELPLDKGCRMGWPGSASTTVIPRTTRALPSQVLQRASDGRPQKRTWYFSPHSARCPSGHVTSIDIPSKHRSSGAIVSTRFPSRRGSALDSAGGGWRTLETSSRAYPQMAGSCGLRTRSFRLTVSPLAVGSEPRVSGHWRPRSCVPPWALILLCEAGAYHHTADGTAFEARLWAAPPSSCLVWIEVG